MAFLNNPKLDDEYKKNDCLWGLEPNKRVLRIPELIKTGTVLDIGVGEGRNALFLASKGFDVTGIDISKEAVEKFQRFATKQNLQVKGEAIDVVDFDFKQDYDVIISIAALHLIKKDQVINILEKIKNQTKIGGINLITVFTQKDIGQIEYPDLYFFAEEELRGVYKDWEILDYDNYTKDETHGKPHQHHFCAILARKLN